MNTDVLSAIGVILGGTGTVATAFVAVFAIRRQDAANARGLAAQAQATREAREHERRLRAEERIWNRRVDLYKRIGLAIRRYIEEPSTDLDGKPLPAAEVDELADLVSEAEMLASKPVADLLNRFMYDAEGEAQIDIWQDFQGAARHELEVD